MTILFNEDKIDFSKLKDINNRDESFKYLRWYIRHHRVEDDEHSDWMLFAAQVEAQYGSFKEETKQRELWKEVFKSLKFSENKFTYLIYKGDVLVRLAMVSLICSGNLDDIVYWLNKAQIEDKIFFTNPEYRPAYKLLSFLQPLLMFKNTLWPSNADSRKSIAGILYVLMPFCRGASAIAFKENTIANDIGNLIKDDEILKTILIENSEELFKIAELCDTDKRFYKSMMFLVANIIEGILYNFCRNLNIRHYDRYPEIEKESIYGLAHICKKYGIIDEDVEYRCRFIQSYRDFIHPARNRHHTYRLDNNFNKMFLIFFHLLLIALMKGKYYYDVSTYTAYNGKKIETYKRMCPELCTP
ncbi:MAG TPA: hypothetical protein VLX29_09260 [Nitrospirota bacterium]|nr:hypothetical protein [Nitrospirota bacterium]